MENIMEKIKPTDKIKETKSKNPVDEEPPKKISMFKQRMMK